MLDPILSHYLNLQNQKKITANLRAELNNVTERYQEMSENKRPIDPKDHADFVERRKALFFQQLDLINALRRSESLERRMGLMVSQREVVAA